MKEAVGAIILVFVVLGYMALLFVIPKVFEEAATRKRRKIVGELIASSFAKLPLTRKQIDIIGRDHRLTAQDIQILLRNQFTEAVKGENEKLRTYFQELYEQLEKEEPFEGLPSNVRLHLERIKEAIGPEKELLMEPLAAQLQDVNISHRRKEKLLWWFTVGSFVVGIIGVIFGAVPLIPSLPKAVTGSPQAVAPSGGEPQNLAVPSSLSASGGK